MQDLNDLVLFAHVVDHHGFAAAGRSLNIPKSRLSRRIAQLEARLGVRLLQRSTRRLAITEIGKLYYRHCVAMLAEARAAQAVIERVQAEPQGLVRVSSPAALAETLIGPLLPRFLQEHPRVEVVLVVTGRRVDLIEEGIDFAVRVRTPPHDDSGLVVRSLGRGRSGLVASPELLAREGRPSVPEDLVGRASLDMEWSGGKHIWRLTGPNGAMHRIAHRPRLVTDDLIVLKQAAIAGSGIVQLPLSLCQDELARGMLETVLPDWGLPEGEVQIVFPSRRGLVPAVRRFIDFLVVHAPTLAECRQVKRIAAAARGPG